MSVGSSEPDSGRFIEYQFAVRAPVAAVWSAWTTRSGIQSFFAPDAVVELRPMGKYEMIFQPDQPAGSRGGEGNVVLAVDPGSMLTVSWNSPPHLKTVRDQRTFVEIRLRPVDASTTLVTIRNSGYGNGGEWDRSFEYFTEAWATVAASLQERFETGPFTWPRRPDLGTKIRQLQSRKRTP